MSLQLEDGDTHRLVQPMPRPLHMTVGQPVHQIPVALTGAMMGLIATSLMHPHWIHGAEHWSLESPTEEPNIASPQLQLSTLFQNHPTGQNAQQFPAPLEQLRFILDTTTTKLLTRTLMPPMTTVNVPLTPNWHLSTMRMTI